MSNANVTTQPPPADAKASSEGDEFGRRNRRLTLARFALPAIFVGFIVLFSLLEPDLFPTTNNAKSLLQTQSVLAILAIALVLPLAIGEFDISVGAVLGLGAIAVTGLSTKSGLPLVPAIIGAILICAAVGLINGFLVAKVGINSLIVTLGSGSIITGGVQWYTNGSVLFSGFPDSLRSIGNGTLAGIPLPAIYLAVAALVMWFLLEQTPVGRYIYAIGGSKEAARLSGISVRPFTILTFVGASSIAGIAGVVQAAQLGSGNPTVGPNFLLPAFAAVFLGATTIRIGTVNVIGAVLAVFTLAVGVNGLTLLGLPFYVSPVFQGLALILAVSATRYLKQEAV